MKRLPVSLRIVLRDFMTEPLGKGRGERDVYLGDIWPTVDEIEWLMKFAMNGKAFRENYAKVKTEPGKLWEKINLETAIGCIALSPKR